MSGGRATGCWRGTLLCAALPTVALGCSASGGGVVTGSTVAPAHRGSATASVNPPPQAACASAAATVGAAASAASAVRGAGEPAPSGQPAADSGGPRVTIAIEPPYKMSEPPQPASKDAYVIDWRDRFRWNKGGVGRIPGALPKPSGHPDPRVIVNVSAVRGPHDAKALQRVARKHHWMAAVRCYRLGAYKDPHLRGWTYATIEVSAAGKVTKTQLRSSELKSAEVAECLAAKLADLALPQAASASEVEVDIRMGPGDEPLPPPDELIVPGDGELTADAMTAGVRAGLPAFEACYRAALASAPELWGRLLIRFHVTASGKLDEAFETVSQFPDLRTKLCVLRAARKLRFRRPSGGGIRFEVPLLFFTDRASLPAGPRAETYPR